MSKIAALVVPALLIGLAACSNDPERPSATDPPSVSTTAEPSAAPSTPTPSIAADGNGCLQGRYQLARFVGVGASETYGTGEGGDVQVQFDDGKYRLTAAGEDPISLTLAGQTGQLLVDGRVTGTYKSSGSKATFTVGDTSGEASLDVDGQQRTLTMDEIAGVLAPKGTAVLACSDALLIVALPAVRLEFDPI
jgi:hypothetical protein